MCDEHPTNFLCPITGDIMRNPITYNIDGHDYTFEKCAIDVWKTTPNGDKNPLTMLPGLIDAIPKQNDTLKSEIEKYVISIGGDPTIQAEITTIEPFSDFQQIQEDEEVARRLNSEINGSPQQIYRNIDRFRVTLFRDSHTNRDLDFLDLVDMIDVNHVDHGSEHRQTDDQINFENLPELENTTQLDNGPIPRSVPDMGGDNSIFDPSPSVEEDRDIIPNNINIPNNITQVVIYYNITTY